MSNFKHHSVANPSHLTLNIPSLFPPPPLSSLLPLPPSLMLYDTLLEKVCAPMVRDVSWKLRRNDPLIGSQLLHIAVRVEDKTQLHLVDNGGIVVNPVKVIRC